MKYVVAGAITLGILIVAVVVICVIAGDEDIDNDAWEENTDEER